MTVCMAEANITLWIMIVASESAIGFVELPKLEDQLYTHQTYR